MFRKLSVLPFKSRIHFFIILFFLFATVANADVIHVAVASNFNLPAKELVKTFESETGHQIKLSSGSSGKFYAQIQQGAPFQVFLSADAQTPERLVKEGFAVASTQITYAIGKLVLWSADPDLIKNNDTVLKKNRFKKIAIANPQLAPYGTAAVETLTQLGVFQSVQSKIVWGENIAQTHQFVMSGNAELGFVSASQVMREGKFDQGSGWVIPESMHNPILQNAVLLSKAKDSVAAIALLDYLKSAKAKKIIEQFGYGVPNQTIKEHP